MPQLSWNLVVTDPPYNVGYHYESYGDKLAKDSYLQLIRMACPIPSVILHYPEDMFWISQTLGMPPEKCVAWTYNANTPRKWRMIAWFGLTPDFSKITQPYKNPNDRRVRKLVENGSNGSSLYDWWNDEQVKNVSDEKTDHPCQIPLAIMQKIIGISKGQIILDPFMGSGSTLRAAKDLQRQSIGIEIDEKYCEIAANRMSQEVFTL